MDPTTAISLEHLNLLGWGQQVIWLSLRIGAMLLLSPFLGTQSVPRRVRLVFALALSAALAPLVPAPAVQAGLNAETVLAIARELAIGAALGFLLRLAVEAVAMAGELVSQGMGLAFAQMVDPVRGTQSAVVSQWFMVITALVFFAVNGHLALIALVAESFVVLPAGAQPAAMSELLDAIPGFAGIIFLAGASIALPLMIAMVTVNTAFGVMGRTAPSLNPIAIGLPAALLTGFVLMIALVPHMLVPLQNLFATAFEEAARLVR
jgi:flagellar biosynthesis protein FliR